LENLKKIIKMKENKDLNKIRHFKGSVSDFKNYFDQRAGETTNAFNTPDYQGFNNVHPTRGKTESPHWNDVNESKNDTGLIIKGRTKADNKKIDDILDDLGLLGEWDAREGHFFLPEEEDMFDELETMIQKEFNKRNVNAYFEGVFESLNEKSINKIQKDWAKITAEMKDTVSAWKSAEGKDKDNLLKKLKDLTSKKKKLESELNTAVGLKDVDIELVDEASFGVPSNGDYSDEMSFGQLEKCIDYSTMIRQRIQQGTSLDPWMHSQIAVAENELNSVWGAIDGDDGVVESTSNKIPSFKNYESLNENRGSHEVDVEEIINDLNSSLKYASASLKDTKEGQVVAIYLSTNPNKDTKIANKVITQYGGKLKLDKDASINDTLIYQIKEG